MSQEFTDEQRDVLAKAEKLNRLAAANPTKRVYCLLGASTWHSAGED